MIEVAFDQAITELAPVVGVKNACAAVGRPRANHYRRHAQSPAPTQPKREPRPQPRALSAAERAEVLAVLHEAGPAKWTYFDLYSIIDIYSRYTVGWMVATRESKELAERLLGDTIAKQSIDRDQLTIHADRGSSMASKPVAFLLADLGVTKSHSRPHCSNDNPFSEAQLKTLKYRPDFPATFGSLQDARAFCATFYRWYNHEHRHSGIGMHTPSDVHHGHAAAIREARANTLSAAYAATPERFVRKHPEPPDLPGTAWINRPVEADSTTASTN